MRHPYGWNRCAFCLLLSSAAGHVQGKYSSNYVNITARHPVVRVIKSKRMRWAGNVARMGEKRGVYRVLVGKPEGKAPPGDPGVDGRIILRWIFRKWDVGVWTASSWLRIGTGGGHL